MTPEDLLYHALKVHLTSSGWKILGGQPPSGTDHIPVIEIKSRIGTTKGSKDSFKPDLIAVRAHQLLILEVKPHHSESDRLKLEAVLDDQSRQEAMWAEFEGRSLRDQDGQLLAQRRGELQLVVALAHGDKPVLMDRVSSFTWTGGTFRERGPISTDQ